MSGKSIISSYYLEDIGDALRYKKGTEETFYPSQMGDAIRSIEGIVPVGSIEIDANGTYDVTEKAEAIVSVVPDLRPLSVSENGSYQPDDFDGYSSVVVDVEPALESLSVTENGLYLPESGVDGYDRVTVDVPTPEPVLDSLSVTENGTYVPPSGVDGFDEVVVAVPTGGEIEWDGVIYPVTDESDQYYADHVFNAVYIPNVYAGDTVIIEALGRGVLFAFRGGQPTSGYMQEYKIGGRTDGNILVRFTLNITADSRNFIIGGYQWSSNGSHSGYDYNCAYGEYIKYKVIHAS